MEENLKIFNQAITKIGDQSSSLNTKINSYREGIDSYNEIVKKLDQFQELINSENGEIGELINSSIDDTLNFIDDNAELLENSEEESIEKLVKIYLDITSRINGVESHINKVSLNFESVDTSYN